MADEDDLIPKVQHSLAEFKEALFDLLVNGAKLQDFVDAARSYLGNPVIVTDNALHPLAFSDGAEISDTFWQVFISNDVEAHINIARLSRTVGVSTKENSEGAYVVEGGTIEHRMIDSYVRSNNVTLALVQVLEYYRMFNEDDFKAVDAFDKAIELLMRKTNAGFIDAANNSELLLSNLLSGALVEPDATGLSLLPMRGRQLLMVIDFRNKTGIEMIPRYVNDMLAAAFPTAMIAPFEDHIVILHNITAPFTSIADEGWKKIEEILAEENLICGVAKPFGDVGGIRRAYMYACRAADIGRRLCESRRIYLFDDIARFMILDDIGDTPSLIDYCDAKTTQLLEYDEQSNTHYFRDLVVYIYTGCKIQESANLLRVHRNTMYYRIEKIEQLLGCNLEDAYVVHMMRCSIEVLHYHYGREFKHRFDIPSDILEFESPVQDK